MTYIICKNGNCVVKIVYEIHPGVRLTQKRTAQHVCFSIGPVTLPFRYGPQRKETKTNYFLF